jgi:hypothetical protein
LRCPGDPIRRIRVPSASPAAGILVLRPPRERPRPWAAAPFLPASVGGVLMSLQDGRFDHQPFKICLARQRGEDLVQNAHLDPAVVAPLPRLVPTNCLGRSRQQLPVRGIHSRVFRDRRLRVRGPRLPLRRRAQTPQASPIDHPEARGSPKLTSKNQR